jgi:hypothetical protein
MVKQVYTFHPFYKNHASMSPQFQQTASQILLCRVKPDSTFPTDANLPYGIEQNNQKATPTLFLPGIGSILHVSSLLLFFSPNVPTLASSMLFSFLPDPIEKVLTTTSRFSISLLGLDPGVQVLVTAYSFKVL